MKQMTTTNNFATNARANVIHTLLAVVLMFSGCTTNDAPTSIITSSKFEPLDGNASISRHEIKSFQIGTLSWRVSVVQNGSGSIGFGAGDVESFPPGTFDFVKWRERIVMLEWDDSFDGKGRSAYLEVYWPNGVDEVYYVDRDKIPIELFQEAIDATKHSRIRDIWSEKPLK